MAGAIPCRCCGRPVDCLDLEAIIVGCRLTPTQAAILKILAEARGNWMSCYQVGAKLYADDPDGGPTDTRSAINVHVFNIRQRLRRFAAELELDGGAHAGFRLVAWPQTRNNGRNGGTVRLPLVGGQA